jgi:type VI secretion system protein VasD
MTMAAARAFGRWFGQQRRHRIFLQEQMSKGGDVAVGILRALLIASVAAAALVAAGCGGKDKTPPPTVVKSSLQSSVELNPDMRGRASPLLLRVYELKSASTFNATDFYSLFDKDEQLMAADIQGREEISVMPGDRKTFERQFKPDSKYIAVLGAYRDIEHARWRAVYEIAPGKTTQVSIYVGKLAVSITGEQQEEPKKKKKLLPW